MKRVNVYIILFIFLMASACTSPPDEQQIRENLDQIVLAVQQRQPKKVVEHLHADFRAQERMGVEEIRRFMIAQFFRNQKINILITGLRIRVEGNSAKVSFRAAITGGASWMPERLDYYQLHTSWVKQDGDWLMRDASWQPVLATA